MKDQPTETEAEFGDGSHPAAGTWDGREEAVQCGAQARQRTRRGHPTAAPRQAHGDCRTGPGPGEYSRSSAAPTDPHHVGPPARPPRWRREGTATPRSLGRSRRGQAFQPPGGEGVGERHARDSHRGGDTVRALGKQPADGLGKQPADGLGKQPADGFEDQDLHDHEGGGDREKAPGRLLVHRRRADVTAVDPASGGGANGSVTPPFAGPGHRSARQSARSAAPRAPSGGRTTVVRAAVRAARPQGTAAGPPHPRVSGPQYSRAHTAPVDEGGHRRIHGVHVETRASQNRTSPAGCRPTRGSRRALGLGGHRCHSAEPR